MSQLLLYAVLTWAAGDCLAVAETHRLDERLHHLRRGGPPEWATFAESPEGPSYERTFQSPRNASEWTLRLRQQDVKQSWSVALNGQPLGKLRVDENDMIVYFPIPAGLIGDGENRLVISQDDRSPSVDDILVGELHLDSRPVQAVLADATLEVEVRDASANALVPARLTILSEQGALQTVGATSNRELAVRPGIVYTSTGRARFGLPPGRYTVLAGRGFEYSLASTHVEAMLGETSKRMLTLRREVPTPGYVACDTHVHTLTHSRHGDATIEERMITLAGEGIELPVATDHNVAVDFELSARSLEVRQYFTPVIGSEVTTAVGHFNVFPIRPGARGPDSRLTEWNPLFDQIYSTPGVKVVILNHARDLHSGFRPFGPRHHNAATGEQGDGRLLRANAMEVINSSATQSDIRQLMRDWMTMLNHGRLLTPVGSSDSHDVGRHFVGQGRTYIRADDRDSGQIDVEEAVRNFVQGRTLVSYGLIAELTVDERYGPGELAPVAGPVSHVAVRVLGPDWVQASIVELYANGRKIHEARVPATDGGPREPGVKWQGHWDLPPPTHDLHLVAVAIGPGIEGFHWKTAKPYQPKSAEWESHVAGCSGAVWLDGDHDGRPTPAIDYARRVVAESTDLPTLLDKLRPYDEAVVIQAAGLWQQSGRSLTDAAATDAWNHAAPIVRQGIQRFLDALRESLEARSQPER